VSFLTIGIIWVNHHTLFKNVAKIDRALLFLNLLPPLLFFVVAEGEFAATARRWIGPFPTSEWISPT
jgi:Endosomal/lysosomal potassium channel TMEM175